MIIIATNITITESVDTEEKADLYINRIEKYIREQFMTHTTAKVIDIRTEKREE